MHKRTAAAALIVCLIGLLAASCSRSDGKAGERTVIVASAAASLRDSLEPIAREYERQHPDVEIRFNYGSSGTLQKQIEQGAPADLFLSAGKKQMDALIAKKLVKESRVALSNRLVLVVRAEFEGSVDNLESLADANVRKIALGQPDTVPAGTYAMQALTRLGLWDKLGPKLVFALDVRQALAFVETGNADAGLVYKTDALLSEKVKLALEVPPDSHDAIEYPFAVLAASKHPREAGDFYRYLVTEAAWDIFRKHGFEQP